jgi:hypothetical protein
MSDSYTAYDERRASQGCWFLSKIFEQKLADFQIFICITVRLAP